MLLIPSISVAAQVNDGHNLLKYCELANKALSGNGDNLALTDATSAGICIGLFYGVVKTGSMYQIDMKKRNTPKKYYGFCMPATGVPAAKGIKMITNYLKRNPNKLNKTDVHLIIMALNEKYPCQ